MKRWGDGRAGCYGAITLLEQVLAGGSRPGTYTKNRLNLDVFARSIRSPPLSAPTPSSMSNAPPGQERAWR